MFLSADISRNRLGASLGAQRSDRAELPPLFEAKWGGAAQKHFLKKEASKSKKKVHHYDQ